MTLKAVLGYLSIAVTAVTLISPTIALASPVLFSAAGSNPADIQASVDAFRNFLGRNNGVGGTFRETANYGWVLRDAGRLARKLTRNASCQHLIVQSPVIREMPDEKITH